MYSAAKGEFNRDRSTLSYPKIPDPYMNQSNRWTANPNREANNTQERNLESKRCPRNVWWKDSNRWIREDMRTSVCWHSPAIRRIAMRPKSAGGTWSPTPVLSPKKQKEENFSVFFSSFKPVQQRPSRHLAQCNELFYKSMTVCSSTK